MRLYLKTTAPKKTPAASTINSTSDNTVMTMRFSHFFMGSLLPFALLGSAFPSPRNTVPTETDGL
jgi:hypothetical protein